MRTIRWAAFLAIAGTIGTGCDEGMDNDAGLDAGEDAGGGGGDAGPDAGMDSDGGMDDAGMMDDGGMDGGMSDGGMDAGPDGGMDGGPLCGNGTLDLGEECDGTMVPMDCEDVLGVGATGMVTCTSGCALNTSACQLCGNAMIEGTEQCDGTNLGTPAATCSTVPGGFMSGGLTCNTSCQFDTADCSTAAVPSAAGQIIVSEIMPNPSGTDAEREWFEVHNPGTAPLNLRGCFFSDEAPTDPDMLQVVANIVVPAGGYATFAAIGTDPTAPGFTPDYRFMTATEFALNNTLDEIVITCGGVEIDRVEYDTAMGWTVVSGESFTLDPRNLNATDNDVRANWCQGASTGGTFVDRGTPDAANDACPVAIDNCRLQSPPSMMLNSGETSPLVFGRVRILGVTERTDRVDAFPTVRAQVGVGPDGSDPATSASWTWSDAAANPSYMTGSPAHEMDYDEYQGTFMAPGAGGLHDYAYRFSGDRGLTWTVCDTNGLPYSPADAGQLTVAAPPPRVTTLTPAMIEVVNGGTGILTVTLDRPASAGGYVVTLMSATLNVTVPLTVTVPAGASTAGIRIRGAAVGPSIITATGSAGGMATATVNVVASAPAPVAGDLVLNEILVDPPDATLPPPAPAGTRNPDRDANCTDSRTNDQSDEYMEIVNTSTHAVTLTGVAIWDNDAFTMVAMMPRFVFPSFVLGPGEAVLVYGEQGGTMMPADEPWCTGAAPGVHPAPFRIGDAFAFATAAVFTGTSPGLSMSNGGDNMRVTATNDRTSMVLVQFSWTSNPASNQSSVLNPELTGTMRVVYTAAPNRRMDRVYSPGTYNDGRPFADASAP